MTASLPGLPSFDYLRPQTFGEAGRLLGDHPDEARLFMGGTDLLVQMRDGLLRPSLLLDVKHLPQMTDIQPDPSSGLRLGAAVNLNRLAEHPAVKRHYRLLSEAAKSVASYQLRNRATMGGNLCNASPAADTAPAALALQASMIVWSAGGERQIPANQFFRGPGENALERGEILTRIDFPTPPSGSQGRYLKLGRNAEGDLAIVGVAVLGFPDGTARSHYRFRIALASVAPVPMRVPAAEEILATDPITDLSIERAAEAAADACRPIDDVRSSAHYRREMVKVFTRRGLHEVCRTLCKES